MAGKGSKGGRPPSDPLTTAEMRVMISKSHRDRLDVVSRALGRQVSDIVRETIYAKIKELEIELAAEEARKRAAFVPKNKREWNKPKGIGVDPDAPLGQHKQPAPTPPPTVTDASLDKFIAYVAAATDPVDQATRVMTVTKIIDDTSASPEDARAVADALDARVKEIEARKKDDPLFGLPLPFDD